MKDKILKRFSLRQPALNNSFGPLRFRIPPIIGALLLLSGTVLAQDEKPQRPIEINRDDADGTLSIGIDGQEAFAYQYGPQEDLAHFYPVRSPSGRSMTVQHPDPYPHHRSFWFADQVRLKNKREVNFYNAFYTREKGSDHKNPYRDRIRHVAFLPAEEVTLLPSPKSDHGRNLAMKLVWEMDWDQTVLTETREMRIRPLGKHEYFVDIVFQVTATEGPVTITSDWVHYAWPYIRMNETFNVDEGGGKITSSQGEVNQEATNGKTADWIDYSAPAADGDPEWEGLAIFSHPDNPKPHRWLTRNYGCFGPRRIQERSGNPFTLEKGDSLTRRVGILVHQGNVTKGQVADRYERYTNGDL